MQMASVSGQFVVVGCELKCPAVKNVQGIEDHLHLGIVAHVMIIDAAVQPQDAGTAFLSALHEHLLSQMS